MRSIMLKIHAINYKENYSVIPLKGFLLGKIKIKLHRMPKKSTNQQLWKFTNSIDTFELLKILANNKGEYYFNI